MNRHERTARLLDELGIVTVNRIDKVDGSDVESIDMDEAQVLLDLIYPKPDDATAFGAAFRAMVIDPDNPEGAAHAALDDLEETQRAEVRKSSRRVFCNATHFCHHWFEDECSEACDRGEHDHLMSAKECTDNRE